MTADVLVFGASGTAGQMIATELARRGIEVTLGGRNPERMARAADRIETATGSRPDIAVHAQPALPRGTRVLVNAAGPFSRTGPGLLDLALAAGTHYVDVANDLPSVLTVLERADEASSRGLSLLTASGFGATAGEAVVRDLAARLTYDALSVEVASMPVSSFTTAGFRQTAIEVLPQGVQVYRDGRLRTRLPGLGATRIATPAGPRTLLPVPVGELEAARRATGAPHATAYSSELPAGFVTRAALPVLQTALRIGPLRRRIADRISRQPTRQADAAPTTPSLAWARITDVKGNRLESVWEFPEGYRSAARAASEVTCRLLAEEGRPGAWFPGQLFGLDIARACGGRVTQGTAEA